MIKSIITLLLCALVIVSCETVVTVPIPDNSGKVTVNAVIAQGTPPYARLTESLNVLESGQFPPIENAEVFLFEDGTLIGQMLHQGDGDYALDFVLSFEAKPGSTYKLDISVPGKDPVTAQVIMPVPVLPNSFELGDTINIEGYPHLEFILEFDDPVDIENFYSVSLNLENSYWGGYPVCWRNLDTEFEGDGEFFPGIDGLPFYCEDVLLRDIVFDGQTKKITLLLPDNDYYYYYYGGESDIYTLYLSSMSEDYFRYKQTSDLQYYNDGNPFAQPTTIFTNVEGGFGIFGAVSQGIVTISP